MDTSSGYVLEFDGYSEHLDSLVDQVTEGFARPSFTTEQFAQTRQKVLDTLSDTTASMPYEHAMEALSTVSTSGVFSREDELKALGNVTEQRLRDFLEEFRQ